MQKIKNKIKLSSPQKNKWIKKSFSLPKLVQNITTRNRFIRKKQYSYFLKALLPHFNSYYEFDVQKRIGYSVFTNKAFDYFKSCVLSFPYKYTSRKSMLTRMLYFNNLVLSSSLISFNESQIMFSQLYSNRIDWRLRQNIKWANVLKKNNSNNLIWEKKIKMYRIKYLFYPACVLYILDILSTKINNLSARKQLNLERNRLMKTSIAFMHKKAKKIFKIYLKKYKKHKALFNFFKTNLSFFILNFEKLDEIFKNINNPYNVNLKTIRKYIINLYSLLFKKEKVTGNAVLSVYFKNNKTLDIFLKRQYSFRNYYLNSKHPSSFLRKLIAEQLKREDRSFKKNKHFMKFKKGKSWLKFKKAKYLPKVKTDVKFKIKLGNSKRLFTFNKKLIKRFNRFIFIKKKKQKKLKSATKLKYLQRVVRRINRFPLVFRRSLSLKFLYTKFKNRSVRSIYKKFFKKKLNLNTFFYIERLLFRKYLHWYIYFPFYKLNNARTFNQIKRFKTISLQRINNFLFYKFFKENKINVLNKNNNKSVKFFNNNKIYNPFKRSFRNLSLKPFSSFFPQLLVNSLMDFGHNKFNNKLNKLTRLIKFSRKRFKSPPKRSKKKRDRKKRDLFFKKLNRKKYLENKLLIFFEKLHIKDNRRLTAVGNLQSKMDIFAITNSSLIKNYSLFFNFFGKYAKLLYFLKKKSFKFFERFFLLNFLKPGYNSLLAFRYKQFNNSINIFTNFFKTFENNNKMIKNINYKNNKFSFFLFKNWKRIVVKNSNKVNYFFKKSNLNFFKWYFLKKNKLRSLPLSFRSMIEMPILNNSGVLSYWKSYWNEKKQKRELRKRNLRKLISEGKLKLKKPRKFKRRKKDNLIFSHFKTVSEQNSSRSSGEYGSTFNIRQWRNLNKVYTRLLYLKKFWLKKFFDGMSSRQLYKRSLKTKRFSYLRLNKWNQQLEGRLAIILLRLRFASRIKDANYLIRKGYVYVNNIQIINPNILIKPNSWILLNGTVTSPVCFYRKNIKTGNFRIFNSVPSIFSKKSKHLINYFYLNNNKRNNVALNSSFFSKVFLNVKPVYRKQFLKSLIKHRFFKWTSVMDKLRLRLDKNSKKDQSQQLKNKNSIVIKSKAFSEIKKSRSIFKKTWINKFNKVGFTRTIHSEKIHNFFIRYFGWYLRYLNKANLYKKKKISKKQYLLEYNNWLTRLKFLKPILVNALNNGSGKKTNIIPNLKRSKNKKMKESASINYFNNDSLVKIYRRRFVNTWFENYNSNYLLHLNQKNINISNILINKSYVFSKLLNKF